MACPKSGLPIIAGLVSGDGDDGNDRNHRHLSRFLLTLSMGSFSRWPVGKAMQQNHDDHDVHDDHDDHNFHDVHYDDHDERVSVSFYSKSDNEYS